MIFSLFYDLTLFLLGLFAFPKYLWECFRYGKYRATFKARLGIGIPEKKSSPVIWVHMVSVGETRAFSALYQHLRNEWPQAHFYFSTTTETGLAEARRVLPGAAAYFPLPFDFSFIMKRVVKKIKPDHLILCEGDFWYHMLTESKKWGAKISLVSGKISERSFQRFSKLPFFARRLFSPIDQFGLQNTLYLERFSKLGIPSTKLHVTGNLKFDIPIKQLTAAEKQKWQEDLNLKPQHFILTIGSTHPGEETLIFNQLRHILPQFPQLRVLLAVRHPERFKAVYYALKSEGLRIFTYTQRHSKTGDEEIVLIDTIGQLTLCYQLSHLALVGGSFVKGIGGHNILEPIQAHIPVLFGPYMEAQQELTELVLSAGAGLQIPVEELASTVKNFLKNPDQLAEYQKRAQKLAQTCRGAAETTKKMVC